MIGVHLCALEDRQTELSSEIKCPVFLFLKVCSSAHLTMMCIYYLLLESWVTSGQGEVTLTKHEPAGERGWIQVGDRNFLQPAVNYKNFSAGFLWDLPLGTLLLYEHHNEACVSVCVWERVCQCLIQIYNGHKEPWERSTKNTPVQQINWEIIIIIYKLFSKTTVLYTAGKER